MAFDATFWVAISFIIFLGILIYFKIPQKIKTILEENINNIRKQIDEADKLKEDAKNILTEHEKKISSSKTEVKAMIDKANHQAEKNVIKTNKEFHNLMDNRKKIAEDKIKQLKNQAIKDIKNTSVKIAIDSVKRVISTSVDNSKLDALFEKNLIDSKSKLKNINS